MKRIGLYVHIPFCIQKCSYCDFVSISNQSCIPDYIKALDFEIQRKSKQDYLVDTIYFGGGTPSILNDNEISCLCQSIYNHWHVMDKPEITIEANPGTISLKKIKAWNLLGINRINLGIQSFHDQHLQQLGRIHNAKEALIAIHCLKDAGFQNVGLDLIYGIPNQTLNEWNKDLLQAISFSPQHLSCYLLTYEPGTQLYQLRQNKKIFSLPDSSVWKMMQSLFHTMAEYDYDHYEISNFASSPHFRSQHNQKYWQHMSYIGLGAASHSFINHKRFWNCADVAEYIQRILNHRDPIENYENLNLEQQIIEYIFLGLRQQNGINTYEFDTLFPYCFKEIFKEVLKELEPAGYLVVSKDSCRLSEKGKFFLDSICQRLINAI
jgi:oxygen-independent coproporphyrinogen-3 oxidase